MYEKICSIAAACKVSEANPPPSHLSLLFWVHAERLDAGRHEAWCNFLAGFLFYSSSYVLIREECSCCLSVFIFEGVYLKSW